MHELLSWFKVESDITRDAAIVLKTAEQSFFRDTAWTVTKGSYMYFSIYLMRT